jgi:RNA polymerase sigma-70 factor, ECF subfamily
MENLKILSDEDLIELVKSKDQELYEEIVKRYQAKLLRYAETIVRSSDQAADVVQQAFIKAFTNLHGFNSSKKFSSWIYRIVHNEAINQIKKYRKEHSLERNDWPEDIFTDKSQDAQEKLEEKEIKNAINQALDKLPIKYQSVLTLTYLEDKSYEEISDILKIPTNTVGTRISRGKKLLAYIYQQQEQS